MFIFLATFARTGLASSQRWQPSRVKNLTDKFLKESLSVADKRDACRKEWFLPSHLGHVPKV
jgi:hypothetical protein